MKPQTLRSYRFFKRAGAAHIVGEYARCCLDLARAETLKDMLLDSGTLVITWDYDDFLDGPDDWGWDQKDIARWKESKHVQEYCALEVNGEVVASLGGIWDADADYRRCIEAELLAEALPFTDLGLRLLT